MKYVKSRIFTTQQFSIEETITEVDDVVSIAKDIIEKQTDVPDAVKKELVLAVKNLNQATDYLEYIRQKTDIVLKYVPADVREKDFL